MRLIRTSHVGVGLAVAATLLILPVTLQAQGSCAVATSGSACAFTNVEDMSDSFDHISFEPDDERDAGSIQSKFANLSSFTISGGSAAIRHTSEHATDFAGEGTEGGPVSGFYRIDWGYFATSVVRLEFAQPVDAVGAFFGGDAVDFCGTDGLFVTLENGDSVHASRVSTGLAVVPNGSDGCQAINGFVGIDSNDGPRIIRAEFRECRDASSLDDIFFGNATGGVNGATPSPFAESPFTSCPIPPPELPGPESPGASNVILPLVSDGELSVTPRDVIFPETSVSGVDIFASAIDATWTATDTTQLGAGWHLTVIATDHLRGDDDSENHVIPVGRNEGFTVACSDSEIVIETGTSPPPTCPVGTQAIPVAGENPLTLLQAGLNEGMGIFEFVPHFELLVPGTSSIDIYRTELLVDIIAGP